MVTLAVNHRWDFIEFPFNALIVSEAQLQTKGEHYAE
jgi:hypothetical protein